MFKSIFIHLPSSMLHRSTRIALHFGQDDEPMHHPMQRSQSLYMTTMQDIVAIVRKFKNQFGLRHAPFIFIYGLVQALRVTRASTGASDEEKYLIQSLDDCSVTWILARQVRQNQRL